MVRNLLSLKCQSAGERQFVCPALPVPERLRETSAPCHGHQLPAVSPVLLEGQPGVSTAQPFPAVRREAHCTDVSAQPWTLGCWSLRRGADLVADASCSGSPWRDGWCCASGLPALPGLRGLGLARHKTTPGHPTVPAWASTGPLGAFSRNKELVPKGMA